MTWKWLSRIFKKDEIVEEILDSIENPIELTEEDKPLYPCSSDNCLVRAACTKPCNKLVWDEKILKDRFEKYYCCPDCGAKEYMGGPCGGGSENIKCAGCGHYFNLGFPLFVERIHCTKEKFNEAW